MTFLLSSNNVFDYLTEHGLCDRSDQPSTNIEPVSAKNFNLLVTFPNNRKLLVKQERYDQDGNAAGEFLDEWKIQEFLQQFPKLDYLRSFLPEVLHFDRENSILVFRYLTDYRDLMDFYEKESYYANEIAAAVGTLLATIHRDTFNSQEYQDYFSQNSNAPTTTQVKKLIQRMERIGPEIFGEVSADGLKFFSLYQRYDSLGQAIGQLSDAFCPSCLAHNDLKLNNLLLHHDWERLDHGIVRLIDWERSTWGDPALDLGTLFSSYMHLWLGSLVISKSLSIEESLQLAVTPLGKIQPSIAAITQAYLHTFPEILEHRSDFLLRAVQFAGFGLLQRIQAMIQYQKSFGNTGIAMLQVAKALLCRPEQSMPTLFGAAIVELTRQNAFAV